jgi:hypothetical protein
MPLGELESGVLTNGGLLKCSPRWGRCLLAAVVRAPPHAATQVLTTFLQQTALACGRWGVSCRRNVTGLIAVTILCPGCWLSSQWSFSHPLFVVWNKAVYSPDIPTNSANMLCGVQAHRRA